MSFRCRENCKADCCGIIGFSKEFADKHEHLIKQPIKEITLKEFIELPTMLPDVDSILKLVDMAGAVFYLPPDLKCVFLDQETFKCKTYEDRPMVCRLYGIDEKLPCPYVKQNGNPRSPAGVRKTQRIIDHDVSRKMKYISKNSF